MRFDIAWQRGQRILPPAISRLGCQPNLFIMINSRPIRLVNQFTDSNEKDMKIGIN